MRILLVEDHQPFAESIEGLTGYGFRIDTFPTAAEGLSSSQKAFRMMA
jgi:DNA-binding response OmpR family regulator